ncbi:ABC transporter substrate-binding protein [Terrabacter sp. MAHUQ-38]|uniref:ABC transporter substrate-binding protein n=1 Tax=unclassified Terrabacter TaxID=2630222 RepID=UPI00165DEDDE|nr:ABC transporter substrate-binding protein [Terrabacter sp. MAHUQ-38]MBC9824116.1 carbohydrate ABC transporter substrate-binding protein [Terrabacter sp. MAHUQ-38]
MRDTRKTVIALAAVGLLAAGCSDPGAASSGPQTGAAAAWPQETARLDGVTLTIWAAQNSNTVAKQTAEDFGAKTGAKIDIVTVPDPYEQSVQTKVASGDKPDLAFWQPTASQLTAINAKQNLVSLDGAPFIDAYKPALKDVTGILDGTRYAALVTVPAVEGVWYNKEVFAKDGINATPKNLDEMLAAARAIKGKGGTPFYEMGGEKWATQWWVQVQLADAARKGLWDRVNQGQEKFTDPTILGAIKKYKSLVDEGLFNNNITSATFADQGKALLSGEAAMVIQVNTFFSQLQAQSKTDELNAKIGFFPISPSGNVGTFIPDQSNALIAFKTGDAKRESAAKQFLTYWLGSGYSDFVKTTNTVSIEEGVETPATVPSALQANADSIGDSVGSMQVSAIVNPDLYLNLANMLAGQATPEKVAEATQAQFSQLAQAIGAPGF